MQEFTRTKLGFIGGGNMGRAIVGGLIASGFPAGNVTVADPAQACRDIERNVFFRDARLGNGPVLNAAVSRIDNNLADGKRKDGALDRCRCACRDRLRRQAPVSDC